MTIYSKRLIHFHEYVKMNPTINHWPITYKRIPPKLTVFNPHLLHHFIVNIVHKASKVMRHKMNWYFKMCHFGFLRTLIITKKYNLF